MVNQLCLSLHGAVWEMVPPGSKEINSSLSSDPKIPSGLLGVSHLQEENQSGWFLHPPAQTELFLFKALC